MNTATIHLVLAFVVFVLLGCIYAYPTKRFTLRGTLVALGFATLYYLMWRIR